MSTSTVKKYGGNGINDGYFEIEYRDDGVYLAVYPPVGKGEKVDVAEVVDKINRKKIQGFKRDIVDLAVLKSDRIPVKIAEAQEELKIDANIVVSVTPDKMKASVLITQPDGGKIATVQDIYDALQKAGVVYGINSNTVENLANFPVYNEYITVAEGTQPENGQNGKIEFFFDINKDRKPTILEDGRVDYRELNLITNVKKGDPLCRVIPEKPGVSGQTVTGQEIKAVNGKPAKIPRGRNVELDHDGLTLIASIDGMIEYIEGKVNVFSTYEVPADVDNSTGNINFVGNVIVRGNVLSGFTIEAQGSVEVWGVVEGATIRAEGDIVLKRGMQGMGKGLLVSGGDIIAKYIEHSNIEAKNNIKAESIMHSNIKCGNKLELGGRKGLLVGGLARVGKEIEAKVIGSYMSTVTELEVGVDPVLKEKYKDIKDTVAKMEEDIKKAEQAINILKKLESMGPLPQEKQEMLAKSVRTKLYYSNKIGELKKEMEEIKEILQQESNGKIRAQNYIYPGVRVTIGTCMMNVRETLQYCTLYRDGADIRVGSISMR